MKIKKSLAVILCAALLWTMAWPMESLTLRAESDSFTPLFTITNTVSGTSPHVRYYCNYSPAEYVNRPVTVHNPDGRSYMFGCSSTSANYAYMQAIGNYHLPNNAEAVASANATVVVISADADNPSTYPMGFRWEGVRVEGSTTTVVSVDGKGNVSTTTWGLEVQTAMFKPGTTNYVITTLAPGADIANNARFNFSSGYNTHNYSGCNYYLDSIGVTSDPEGLIERIREASEPLLSLTVQPSDNHAKISWNLIKSINGIADYQINLLDMNDTLLQTKTVSEKSIVLFLDPETDYQVEVIAMDKNGNTIGQSIRDTFRTSQYAPLYTVTNSFNNWANTYYFVGHALNATIHEETPSQWHPDGKYASFGLHGSNAIEIHFRTGFDAVNTRGAKAVVYTVEGGSDLKRPEGSDPLTFRWSSNSYSNIMKDTYIVTIDKVTGKRSLSKSENVVVRPNTVNFVIMELTDNADISGIIKDARFWNPTTCVGYTGTVYVDDYGISHNPEALISALMAPSLQQFETEGTDMVLDGEPSATFVKINGFVSDKLENVAEYRLQVFKTDDFVEYLLVETKELANLTGAIVTTSPNKAYAAQLIALDEQNNVVSASNVFGFRTKESDITVTADARVTTADISWEIPHVISHMDKAEVSWYRYVNGNQGDLVGRQTVSGTSQYSITGLFPEDTYLVKVHAFDPSGNKINLPGSKIITMNTALTMALTPGITDLTVDWVVSEELIGIAKYTIQLSIIDKDGNWNVVSTLNDHLELTATFTDLLPKQQYGITLVAEDAQGKALTYEMKRTITTNTKITLTGESSLHDVHLSWTVDSGLTGVVSYRVDWYGVSEDDALSLISAQTVQEKSVRFDELPIATKYAAQIAALDATGQELTLSNRLVLYTKAPLLYDVTNTMSGAHDVYYCNFHTKRYVRDEVSIYHPDGNFFMFNTTGNEGGTYPMLQVNTYFNQENTKGADAIVMMIRADANNMYNFPMRLSNANELPADCPVSVISIDSGGNTILKEWGLGKTMAFDPGTANYIIIELPKGTDISAIPRIRFDTNYAQTNYPNCTYYIDDVGVTQNALQLKMDLLDVPEYHFYPLPAQSAIKVTGKYEASYVDLSWNKFVAASWYAVNVYRVNLGGNYVLDHTAKTSLLTQRIPRLTRDTAYAAQVIALDDEDGIISASNVFTFTTMQKDEAPYLKGILPAEKGFAPCLVQQIGDTVEVYWDLIGGVSYYTVALYQKTGNTYRYIDHKSAEDEGFVYFDYLNERDEYYAQVILYDLSDSIIFAFEPTRAIPVQRQIVEDEDDLDEFDEEYDEETDIPEGQEETPPEEKPEVPKGSKPSKTPVAKPGEPSKGSAWIWWVIGGVVLVASATGVLFIIRRARKKTKRDFSQESE